MPRCSSVSLRLAERVRNLKLQKRNVLEQSPWEMGEATQLRINDGGGEGLPETREHQEIMLPKTRISRFRK